MYLYPYVVDPANIPASLSNPQLEYFILFAIAVAGKTASQTFTKLNKFFARNVFEDDGSGLIQPLPTPFEVVRSLSDERELKQEIAECKFGQYTRIERAWYEVVKHDVEDIGLDTLESIPGIGPKTARFIMLYSDPSFQGVPLDTHILKFLAMEGYGAVPKSTPPAGPAYRRLEALFQKQAARRGMSVRELDTEVWKSYAVRKEV